MILFGHIGITTAVIKKCEKLIHKDKNINIDYRVVFIGSILPDIIDKPLALFLHHTLFTTRRIYAHTLMFSLILIIIGVLCNLKNRNRNNILILGLCSLIHIFLDGVWLSPKVFMFPLYGVNIINRYQFIKVPYITKMFTSLLYDVVGEVLGIILLYKILIKSYKNNNLAKYKTNGL